jgi:hypothetical protein
MSSNTALIVMVPVQPLHKMSSIVSHPLTQSQLAMAYSLLKEQLYPFFQDDTIPVSPDNPPGPGKIVGFNVGGHLNGMLFGTHQPITQETRLEEMGEGPVGFKRAEIRRLAKNCIVSREYYHRASPIAGEIDGIINLDRKWTWLTNIQASDEYYQEFWKLKETPGQEDALHDHLFQHPREEELRKNLEVSTPALLIIVGVHF